VFTAIAAVDSDAFAVGLVTRRRRIDGRCVSDLNEVLLEHNLLVVLTGVPSAFSRPVPSRVRQE
jgi:hypothetical protein